MATSPTISSPKPPPLPEGLSPDSIDTLPVLSSLLARLHNPNSISAGSTAGSPPAASPSQLAPSTGPLTFKDIPTATDELKHKVQKARVQVRELPDVERSLDEQEEEIRELEQKIREQREALEALKNVGVAAKREKQQRNVVGSKEDNMEF